MGELQHYEVEINGYTTTLRLTEAEAKQRGLTKKAPAPKNKAAQATDNK